MSALSINSPFRKALPRAEAPEKGPRYARVIAVTRRFAARLITGSPAVDSAPHDTEQASVAKPAEKLISVPTETSYNPAINEARRNRNETQQALLVAAVAKTAVHATEASAELATVIPLPKKEQPVPATMARRTPGTSDLSLFGKDTPNVTALLSAVPDILPESATLAVENTSVNPLLATAAVDIASITPVFTAEQTPIHDNLQHPLEKGKVDFSEPDRTYQALQQNFAAQTEQTPHIIK